MSKTTVRAEGEHFIVDYADEEAGLFVQTGYFTTEEAAQERANILETQELIGLEDLAGDVAE
jgi:hypothetical protein